ncbi:putative amino acid transporter, transmembrane domain-containing protein [Rosa chinensis]|uniref:Putative amino acid transporter, transmembrane domain-containing protein n=1 Tax=Rosa chinensis TaxID=74649 RepID=A0A2P6PZE7_ROSCH|nr:lysine histidine transporter-like 8 [Rosa chinensis]PRQ27318.1 putative amino acid transporter, transmembrane domain-containing protein [Rosa chinensis]
MAESNQRELDIHDEFMEEDDISAIPVSTTSPPEIDSASQDHVDDVHNNHVATAPPVQTDQSNPSGMSSPSLSEKPLLNLSIVPVNVRRVTPRSHTPNFFTPLGSPIRRAIRLTKFDPQDAWLPITESRNGNAYYAAFHTLCSGIGIPALVLPVSFTVLGWTWGIISLTVAFTWQLYTLWLLVKLHESTETGMRYSRYLQLFSSTFGDKMGKIFAVFPIYYLSGGTCVALIIVGGSSMKLFYEMLCGHECTSKPLTSVEWYLVFTCAAVVLSQLPNLNSIAGVSLIGAITAIGYCTIMWLVAVTEGRLDGVSYDPKKEESNIAMIFSILNALGIIAFAFKGHNLTLEIQATMPSSDKKPSHVPMWRGVKFAYVIIALCLFPLAIGGYWAYGHMIPPNGGMLTAIYQFHGRDTSTFILALTALFIIVNAVSSFQIFGMPMFDDMESKYITRFNKPCPWWLRSISRAMFGFGCFFMAVAIPFLGSFAGLIGGIAIPITFAYPCFLWLKIKKPKRYSFMWLLNWTLGLSGTALSIILIAAGIYVVIDTGIQVSFFKPQ